MIVAILLVSLAGVLASLFVPGLSALLLLAGPVCVAAALVLVLVRRRGRPARAAAELVLLDGSNILHWQDNVPRLDSVLRVVEAVRARGQDPGVIFDANAGYKIGRGYQHDGALARLLGLPVERVFVVPKGTPADVHILRIARERRASVISNDRFRDWAADFPEVSEPGFLIRGGITQGKVWLSQAVPAPAG